MLPHLSESEGRREWESNVSIGCKIDQLEETLERTLRMGSCTSLIIHGMSKETNLKVKGKPKLIL